MIISTILELVMFYLSTYYVIHINSFSQGYHEVNTITLILLVGKMRMNGGIVIWTLAVWFQCCPPTCIMLYHTRFNGYNFWFEIILILCDRHHLCLNGMSITVLANIMLVAIKNKPSKSQWLSTIHFSFKSSPKWFPWLVGTSHVVIQGPGFFPFVEI